MYCPPPHTSKIIWFFKIQNFTTLKPSEALKGTVSRVFLLQVCFINHLSVANLPPSSLTGDKFTAGVNDTGGHTFPKIYTDCVVTPTANLQSVPNDAGGNLPLKDTCVKTKTTYALCLYEYDSRGGGGGGRARSSLYLYDNSVECNV